MNTLPTLVTVVFLTDCSRICFSVLQHRLCIFSRAGRANKHGTAPMRHRDLPFSEQVSAGLGMRDRLLLSLPLTAEMVVWVVGGYPALTRTKVGNARQELLSCGLHH
ncbi:hypothetical protein BaRGS_00025203 [Batillaria attramentaria]|uniref:Secreted protein n=1 Tax=Batillaria attramentaria TaxID=370345 RepID=A0ABD0K8W8_9CAEN